MSNENILEVKNLTTRFFTKWGVVKAVEDVSFSLNKGEVLGLVGESGCGKTMTCLSIMRLVPEPLGRIVAGQILLQGDDLLKKSEAEMRRIRGSKISMILQDPLASLNPVFTIGNQLTEPIKIHRGLKGKELWEEAKNILKEVRITSPEIRMKNWPHELSGGMRQRVVGGISISCNPLIIIADEPTTSLDVTIQSQYLSLLREIVDHTELTMLFVTHDFGIISRMCNRVAVMYAGRIIELGDIREIFNHPAHPYTKALMKSIPRVEEKVEKLLGIEGQPPKLFQLPKGCSFRPRCMSWNEKCNEEEFPPMIEITSGHKVSCWLY